MRYKHTLFCVGAIASLITLIAFATPIGTHAQKASKQKSLALLDAIFEEDTATVRRLLREGGDANAHDKEQGTALISAVIRGNKTLVDLLLTHGAKVNTQSYAQTTALTEASGRGYYPIVIALLQHKADVTLRDKSGTTALYGAARSGYPSIVKALLVRNASVDATDNEGNTPLFVCVREWAVLNRSVAGEGSIIEQARPFWQGSITWRMSEFMRQKQVGYVDERTTQKLIVKLQSDYEKATELLLKQGADIAARNKQGKTVHIYLTGKGGASIRKTFAKYQKSVTSK